MTTVDQRPDGVDPQTVYGPKNLSIEVLRGNREEAEALAGIVPAGWVRLGVHVVPDGDGKFIGVFVNQKIVTPAG